MLGRPLLLATLYVAQALPLGFFAIAMPAILRSRGVGLEQIGVLSALAAPFLLKFAWAPLVDRWGAASGHYRSWLLPLEALAVVTVLAIAACDPVADGGLVLGLGALFMVLAATQDIATDGLAVRLLGPHERGLGNGIQVGGYYLGQVVGGGLLLVLIERFSWGVGLSAMAALLALPLPLVVLLKEPSRPVAALGERVGFSVLARFLRLRSLWPWIAALLVWRLGETMALWMVQPMLVDRGVSLDRIGWLLGVFGSSGALAGALVGGYLAGKWGRFRALVVTGALVAPSLALYAVFSAGWVGWGGLQVFVVVASMTGGAATAVLYTAAMDACSLASAGTDFTLQQSLAAFGPIVAAAGSGFSAAALGYPGHFLLAATLQVVLVLLFATWGSLRRGLTERALIEPVPERTAAARGLS